MPSLGHLDPSVFLTAHGWVQLLTLTVLEIVLGIDNIIVISILSDELPQAQQRRARRTGLGLAMITRLLLLLALTWLSRLTAPLFNVAGWLKEVHNDKAELVVVAQCDPNDRTQLWEAFLIPNTGDNYRFQNFGRSTSSACLTQGSNSQLIQGGCLDHDNQLWTIRDMEPIVLVSRRLKSTMGVALRALLDGQQQHHGRNRT